MKANEFQRLSPRKQRDEFERLSLGFSETVYKKNKAAQDKALAKAIEDKQK